VPELWVYDQPRWWWSDLPFVALQSALQAVNKARVFWRNANIRSFERSTFTQSRLSGFSQSFPIATVTLGYLLSQPFGLQFSKN